MTNTTNVKQLKLNIMTQAQYDTITPSPSELYMITDAEVVPVDDAISSTSENPVQNKVIYTALNGKQDTLVSGTNIKTVNNSSLLGSGNITIDSLPSQSGQSGKFLTTNGTAASWAPVTVPVKISDLTDDTATYPIDKADTLTGLTATVAELNYTDGVTSNIQTQLNGKQATLVSGTNIKTINSTTLLGSGNISVQPTIDSNNKLSSDLVDDTNHTHKFATSAQLTQIGTNQSNISTINGKIPSAASTTNQLADKAFVNSSVQTATANFRGNWSTWANVPTSASSYPADYAGSTTPTVNDYLVVQDASDYTGETLEGTWRFKYTGTWSTDGKAGWNPEYQVNETPLTSAQLAALNSGITSSDVALIGTALQPNDNISELTNDSGYITGISSSDVTTALGYTPYNATNPSGYISGITSSDVTTALGYTPQVELTSGTNIKTVNNNSLLGSGNITIDSLPSQSGQSGKFLTTNGTTASWSTVSIPTVDQTFDGTSANAQSGVAIEGELANYVKSQEGNITISNNGTDAEIMYVYEEDGTLQEGYAIGVGDTPEGTGVIFEAANRVEQKGYLVGVVPDGLGITDMVANQSAVLTVSNNNLAVNGEEVALQSDIPDISTKQDTLVSGTNIKTINNNSLLGSGNITIDSLPSQSGQSGKFLTTNGTTASWSTISIPTVDQTFNSSSANAQSGVAIAGELANYLQASSGNVTFTNGGTVGGITYEDSGTGEMYGTFIGYTPFGHGVMMGAVDPNGYLLGVTSSGINILKGTTTSPTNGIALTVTNNNTLAIGGDEVATQTWVGNQGYITSAALSTLTDVALSSPTQGQNLTYDATLGKWKNTSTTATVAWGGITGTLADQTDLNTALGGKQATLVSGTNIKTINSTSLLGSGNITIDSLPSQSGQSGKYLTTNGTTASWSTISMPTVDQTYDGTSTNAQSGVAIAGAGFLTSIPSDYLQNTATATNSLTILGTTNNQNNSILIGYSTTTSSTNSTVIGNTAVSGGSYATALGYYARANGQYTTAIGNSSYANYQDVTAVGHNSQATAAGTLAVGSNSKATAQRATSIGYSSQATQYQATALGYEAKATANSALQIGTGTNSTANTLQVGTYTLLDTSTGLIPDARISSNIARTSAIPTVPTNISAFTNDSGYITGITSGDVTTALGYTPYNSTNPNGYISSASLSTLTDVALSSPTQGQNLTYDATLGKWKNTSTTATVAWGGITGTLADQTDLNTALGGKQATLVSGTNIKTINSTSLLGSGNIEVLQNTATGTNSLTLLGTATSSNTAINIGYNSSTTTGGTVAIGTNASTSGTASISIGAGTESSGIDTIAIGDRAKATANNAIQIGSGTNNTANKFNVRSYELLDLSTGLIPDARISSNIARTSDIPSITVDQTYDSTSANAQSGVAIAGAGFLTSSDLTNYVTTSTDQNITGTKTFVGQKKIGFKQSSSSDKLGFTLYNNSGTEKGYLEYNPSNTVDSVPLMTLGNYATASGGLTHVGFRKYSSISGASGAYNLLAPLISDARTPFNLTTTYTNFYLPLGFTDGTTTVTTAKSGLCDLSSILPDISTKQDTLVSGTNIKTINSTSLLGSGNIEVLQNTATATDSITILGGTSSAGSYSVNIGIGTNITYSKCVLIGYGAISGVNGTAIGYNAGSSNSYRYTTSIGSEAKCEASYSIQLGKGTNSTDSTLAVGFNGTNYQLLDGTTGLIPDARISSNIARTSQITTPTYDSTNERITW